MLTARSALAADHPTAQNISDHLGNTQSYPVPVTIYWGLIPRDDRGLDPSDEDEDDACGRTFKVAV